MTGALKVLVTGGSGFIGRHVVAALHSDGHDVVVADLNTFPDDEFFTVVGDLCDPDVQRRAITSDLDAIVHLAAFTSVLQSVQQPAEVHATNVEMTAGLLEQARLADVRAFVFASTNAVIGDVGQDTIVETMPLAPLTPYGGTKAAAEMLLSGYAGSFGMRCPVLRLTNVYGAGMGHKDSFVPRLMRAAAGGGEVEIYGDGEQRRDLVFVGDVARAMSLAVADWPSGPVIIGGSRSYTVSTIAQAARDATDKPIRASRIPAKPGEMPAVVVDIARARSRNFEPSVSLVEGMRQVWVDFAPDDPQD